MMSEETLEERRERWDKNACHDDLERFSQALRLLAHTNRNGPLTTERLSGLVQYVVDMRKFNKPWRKKYVSLINSARVVLRVWRQSNDVEIDMQEPMRDLEATVKAATESEGR